MRYIFAMAITVMLSGCAAELCLVSIKPVVPLYSPNINYDVDLKK